MRTRMNAFVMIILLAFLFKLPAFAQSEMSAGATDKYQLNEEIEDLFGYTQAVKRGNTIYISGIASGGDGATQIQNVYRGLQKVLENYGLSFENVVKENLYALDIKTISENMELRKKFYNGHYPAATWVEVSALVDPSAKLEVELIAVVP